MKLGIFTAIVLVFSTLVASAHPRHHHHYRHYARHQINPVLEGLGMGLAVMLERAEEIKAHRIHDGRPRAWCGWFMRQLKGVADTSYNLAREWTHYGTNAGGPRVGAVVVWPHHVGEIVGECGKGSWMVHSGNDGHAERTRCRSLRGAIAFRM